MLVEHFEKIAFTRQQLAKQHGGTPKGGLRQKYDKKMTAPSLTGPTAPPVLVAHSVRECWEVCFGALPKAASSLEIRVGISQAKKKLPL